MSNAVNAGASFFEGQAHGRNASALKKQAKVAASAGYRDEEAQRREARQFMGLQAAAMAEAGGGVGGSNELLMKQSAALAELDALNIRFEGLQRAKGLKNAAKQEKAAETGSYLRAGASLLSMG